MGEHIRFGEFLLGVEGLALLRLADRDAATARASRVAELRTLIAELDGDAALDGPATGTEHDLDEGYRIWSETYDRPLRLFPIESPPVHRLIDRLPPGVVVDAACGTGRHSAYLVRAGHTVIGVDRSEPMLAHARRSVATADFRLGDLGSLPVDDGAIDAVVCALALVHVGDLTEPLAEFARVLKPGGRLIISDVHPVLTAIGWQAQFPIGSEDRGFIRLHRHQLSDYVQAGARSGLTIRGCWEPTLTAEAARTPTAGRIGDASEHAFAGLPAVVVWDFERT